MKMKLKWIIAGQDNLGWEEQIKTTLKWSIAGQNLLRRSKAKKNEVKAKYDRARRITAEQSE